MLTQCSISVKGLKEVEEGAVVSFTITPTAVFEEAVPMMTRSCRRGFGASRMSFSCRRNWSCRL